jgi:hypothetical protein
MRLAFSFYLSERAGLVNRYLIPSQTLVFCLKLANSCLYAGIKKGRLSETGDLIDSWLNRSRH